MPVSSYPTGNDVRAKLEAAGLTVGTALSGLLEAAARAGVQKFERETGRRMLGDPELTTRYYDPPVTAKSRLRIDECYSLSSVVYAPVGAVSTTYTLNDEYWLKPDNAAARGLPFEWIEFRRRWVGPLAAPFRRALQVTARFGYAALIPDLAVDAMVGAGLVSLWPSLMLAVTGGLLSWTEADVSQSVGAQTWPGLQTAYQGVYDAGVRAYRRWEI